MEDYSTHKIIQQFIFPHPAKANEPAGPFTVGACRASGGLQGGFPSEMPLTWKKGCSKYTLLEYSLVVINIFRLLFPW
jgi:hypothetical protein